MASSSEDLTFSKIISIGKGWKIVNGQPKDDYDIGSGRQTRRSYLPTLGTHLRTREKPSPCRTLPSPTSATSNTHMQRPTSWRTRFAYFLFGSLFWGGRIERSLPGSCPVVRKAVENAAHVRKEGEMCGPLLPMRHRLHREYLHPRRARQSASAALCFEKASCRVSHWHAHLDAIWVYGWRERRDDKQIAREEGIRGFYKGS